MIIFLSVLVLVILILLITNIKIVPQSMVFVVERLGSYYQTWDNGVHFKVPFVDHIAKRVSFECRKREYTEIFLSYLPLF